MLDPEDGNNLPVTHSDIPKDFFFFFNNLQILDLSQFVRSCRVRFEDQEWVELAVDCTEWQALLLGSLRFWFRRG